MFLVHGQQVSPIKKDVVGVLGRSVIFNWTVNRRNENVSVFTLILYNGTAALPNRRLFILNGEQPDKVKGVAIDRLNATISGDIKNDIEVVYTVIFENLQFPDASTSYHLQAVFGTPTEPFLPSTATITLVKVEGTHFIFVFVLYVFFT